MSFSSMDCLAYGNKVSRTGDPPWMASTSLTGATIMVFFRPGLVAFLLRAKGEPKSRSRRPVHTVPRRSTTGDFVARITESLRKRARLLPVLFSPPRVRRLDHVHAVHFQRMASFVF